jgi:hypothetical protein
MEWLAVAIPAFKNVNPDRIKKGSLSDPEAAIVCFGSKEHNGEVSPNAWKIPFV